MSPDEMIALMQDVLAMTTRMVKAGGTDRRAILGELTPPDLASVAVFLDSFTSTAISGRMSRRSRDELDARRSARLQSARSARLAGRSPLDPAS